MTSVKHHLRRILSAKAAAKDIAKKIPPRKPKLCARKHRESRRESFSIVEPDRYPVYDAAQMDLTVIIYISIGKKQLTNLYKFGIEHDLTMEKWENIRDLRMAKL